MTDPRIDPEIATAVARLEADGWLPLRRETVTEARRVYRDLALARRGDAVTEVGSVARRRGVRRRDRDRRRRAGLRACRRAAGGHGGLAARGRLGPRRPRDRRRLGAARVRAPRRDRRVRRLPARPGAPAPRAAAPTPTPRCAGPRPGGRRTGSSSPGTARVRAWPQARALLARDWGPQLDAQLLLYPGLDPSMASASMAENADGPFLTRADLEWFWERYLPDPALRHDPSVALTEAARRPAGRRPGRRRHRRARPPARRGAGARRRPRGRRRVRPAGWRAPGSSTATSGSPWRRRRPARRATGPSTRSGTCSRPEADTRDPPDGATLRRRVVELWARLRAARRAAADRPMDRPPRDGSPLAGMAGCA